MSEFYVYIHVREDTNLPFYVGKGRGRRAYIKSNRTSYWKNIAKKVGYRVEFLAQNLSETQAFSIEEVTIQNYRAADIPLVNFTDGGEGVSGRTFSEETRKRLSEKLKGNKNSAGRVYTAEQKLRHQASLKNRPKPTEAHIQRLSENRKAYFANGGVHPNKGKKMSAEQREKLSKVKLGKKLSEEHKNNISKAHLRRNGKWQ